MNKSAEMAYWINERYAMKLRRDNTAFNDGKGGVILPWKHGWSNDPIMGTTRWCNVHREDDKVTRWLAENWRPEHHEVWEIVLARMLNYIPTLEELMQEGFEGAPLPEVAENLKVRRARGEKVFTSAYTISTCGQRMDKIDYVIGVVQEVKDRPNWPWDEGSMELLGPCNLKDAHRALTRVMGLGSFLAAQVVADLKNTAGHPLQRARDWWTWAALGPGSLRGLQAFYGAPIAPRAFLSAATAAYEETKPLISEDIPPIHMQDWQNCLCEFSKYMKLKENRGHARNRYPSTAR